MPPAQCPECGRFLAKSFVQALATEPADCPKCGLRLSPAHFPDTLGQAAAPDAPAEEPAGAAALRDGSMPDPDPASVRPPDLDPGDVRRDAGTEAVAAWDQGGDVVELDRFRAGRRPPPDGAIVAGAGAAGAIIGALLARRWGIGVVLGFAAGVAAAATSRQVWRLPE